MFLVCTFLFIMVEMYTINDNSDEIQRYLRGFGNRRALARAQDTDRRSNLGDEERMAVVSQHPRPDNFKEEIIQAFYDGIKHRPETTFGNVKGDVLKDKDPAFAPFDFCRIIRQSPWKG